MPNSESGKVFGVIFTTLYLFTGKILAYPLFIQNHSHYFFYAILFQTKLIILLSGKSSLHDISRKHSLILI